MRLYHTFFRPTLGAILIVSCGDGSTLPSGEPRLVGTITSRAARLVGVADASGPRIDSISAMLVEGGPGCEQRALFFISGSTRVMLGRLRADTGALTVGRRVAVWSDGFQLDSCPPQIAATAVQIEP